MFDWFWEFLYSITKSILRIIDGLMACANKLCGIDSITVDGTETDFLSYLLKSKQVWTAFTVAACIGLIVLVFFTILAILRLIVKEKPDMTPAQICVKAFKSVLMFLFLPAIMIVSVWVANIFMQQLYKATLAGSSSIGNFLFTAFGENAWYNPDNATDFLNGTASFEDTATVKTYLELSNFDFFASWVTGAVVLWNLAWALLVFVDRAISIVILYILSPFSVASSVLDDGAHFKLWREQVLTKFFVGFGTILALNIYCLIVLLIMNSSVQFFDNSFLNYLCKILFILGGAVTMKKAMALVGNLVSSGGGSNELRDTAFSGNPLMGGLKTLAGVAAKPFTWGGSRIGNAVNRGIEDKIGNKLFGSHYGGGRDGTTGDRNSIEGAGENGEGNANHNNPDERNGGDVRQVLLGEINDDDNEPNRQNNNQMPVNNNNLDANRQNVVVNAMNNGQNNENNNANNNEN